MLIIGDVAGQFKTLMALLKKCPDRDVLFVGDLVDRGPQSKDVVEWVMKNAKSLMGNHEHMMLNAYLDKDYYERRVWEDHNGGDRTLASYGVSDARELPEDHMEWIGKLPLYHLMPGYLISHAPLRPGLEITEAANLGGGFGGQFIDYKSEFTFLWNRKEPVRRAEIQVFGHNAYHDPLIMKDELGKYAYGIDTSANHRLCAFDTETRIIYEQDYILR